MTQNQQWSIFLGGRDLEMIEIARMLATCSSVEVHDQQLSWGATASAYSMEIRAAIHRGDRVAIIELPDDLPADIPRDCIVWIDHHGMLAGVNRPTSLEQIFQLMEFSPQQWTRDLMLVAANDRGHIRGMRDAGATPEEIQNIRARDRAAQGITPQEEEQGRDAAAGAVAHFGGRLLAVQLPHTRTATVTDILPDAENLIVFCPGQTVFFGSGRSIEALRVAYPEGWFGGDLPERGYWGVGRELIIWDVVQLLENWI